tara:strand:+ start:67 stop:402 length:336 start_codon:yes stop_codon:yes gene_type:complete
MESDGEKLVTFTFTCTESESVNLKLRLKYDNLTQVDFFRSILSLYVEKDLDMIDLVSKIKLKLSAMGRNKIKRSNAEIQQGKDLLINLGITASDKQDIFDLIESNSAGEYD